MKIKINYIIHKILLSCSRNPEKYGDHLFLPEKYNLEVSSDP